MRTPTPLTISTDAIRGRHARALADLIDGEVRFGVHDRMLYATDASIYQVEPIGVVIPDSIGDLHRVVAYCREHGLPMLPRGGGTSLAGQCTNHAVVIDLSVHCRAILRVDEQARTCLVEPGITIADLNRYLASRGLFFAPDPSTVRQANIGGVIGNNAAGTRSIKYGRTSENLEGVEVLLADGSCLELDDRTPSVHVARLAGAVTDIVRAHEDAIRARFPKTIRRNAGYALDMILAQLDAGRDHVNLAPLMCGSEGTLAFTTAATLKLHPIPAARGLVIAGFASLEAAIDAVCPLLETSPSAVELLDDMVIDLARANAHLRPTVDLMPQPAGAPVQAVLYVEHEAASDPAELEDAAARTRALLTKIAPNAGVAVLRGPDEIAAALALRQAGEPLLHAVPGSRKPLGFVEDNVVPVEHLSEFVRAFKALIEKEGTTAAFYAHASVGVLHVRPLLDLRDPDDRKRMEVIATGAADLAGSLGGVMSGEHGDGRARGPMLERHFGPGLMEAFRRIKALFDPDNLLNPDDVIHPGDVPSIHERTRIRPRGEDVHAEIPDTYFDYGPSGFGHAVELCNGSGVCRKTAGGVMCPSYMATLDERHSTRGRGNALRLAMTGQLRAQQALGESEGGGPLFDDPETLETLRLCLSCKACKTECPTNVDVAHYKAEYLAHSFTKANGAPLQARLFSAIRTLNRVGSALAPISNWIAGAPPTRLVNRALAGVSTRRSIPVFRRSLLRQMRGHRDGLPPDAPVVALFADCFTTWNEPDVGIAAIRVLGAFGYRVRIVDAGCCGRPHISSGLLADAQRVVRATAASLRRAMEGADALLVCEPSCLSAITDDWQDLRVDGVAGRDDHRADLADTSRLVEQFLDERWDDHPRRPSFARPGGDVLLHAHCHQRALWGAESSAAMLRHIAGDRLRILDATCCGMAGSFGYTADRYDLSMRIGELGLFPAARSLGDGDVLLASGTSCRHQVMDGASRASEHPVRFIADHLA